MLILLLSYNIKILYCLGFHFSFSCRLVFCTIGVTTDIDISSQNKPLALSDLLSLFAGSVLDFEYNLCQRKF